MVELILNITITQSLLGMLDIVGCEGNLCTDMGCCKLNYLPYCCHLNDEDLRPSKILNVTIINLIDTNLIT